jgi:hypothetical protein
MNDGLEYLGRARIQGIMLLVVVFLVGAFAGVAADRLLPPPPPPVQPPPPAADRMPGPPAERRLPEALERLDLSAPQRSAIESLIVLSQPGNRALMQQVMPRLRAHNDSLQAQIRLQLAPPQRAKFDEFIQARRGPGFDGPPRGGPGGPPGGFGMGGPRGMGGPPGMRGARGMRGFGGPPDGFPPPPRGGFRGPGGFGAPGGPGFPPPPGMGGRPPRPHEPPPPGDSLGAPDGGPGGREANAQ